jgi:tetratricopeptide (TPR) repeat protein
VHQGLGDLNSALAAYDAALRHRPNYGEALLNRGAVLEQLSRFEDALAAFDALAALRPQDGMVHFNRGSVLQRLGRLDAALAAYDRACEAAPADPEAALNRGNVLQKLGRYDDALEGYGRALGLRPNYAQAHYNRGIALHRLGRRLEAVAAFDAALALRPDYAEAFCNRGNVLNELGRFAEALASYDAALKLKSDLMQARINRANVLFKLARYEAALEACAGILKYAPDHPQALCVQGASLQWLGRFDAALVALDRAIDANPGFPEAWLNRGNVLQELGRLEEALASYDQALRLCPNYAEVLSSRGVALKELGRFAEALASFDAALALKPDYPDARNNRAGSLLLKGDLLAGFEAFEGRWERSNAPRKTLYSMLPTWNGEPLGGRRILVWDEQGLGDLIQFCRYLPPLAALAGDVTLLCRAPMVRLLGTLAHPPRFIEHVADESAYDYQIALMSLPHQFRTSRHTVPSQLAYLRAEAARVEEWHKRIGGGGFRVGVCWRGNTKINLERSVPLSALAVLAGVPGIRLISLMKDADAEVRGCGLPIETLGPDFDSGPHAFLETAAVMMNLDCIVSSDTSIAHLAGALGRPTYLALKRVADWRWLEEGDRSPWYPTMQLVRQNARGEWGPVFDHIAAAVAARLLRTA